MHPGEESEDLLARVAVLPKADVDQWRSENIRHRAQAELRKGGRQSALSRLYNGVVEPVSVLVVSGGYLAWAAQRVWTLLGS